MIILAALFVAQDDVKQAVERGCRWLSREKAPPEILLLKFTPAANDEQVSSKLMNAEYGKVSSTREAAFRWMAWEKSVAEIFLQDLALGAQFLADNQGEDGQWGEGEKIEPIRFGPLEGDSTQGTVPLTPLPRSQFKFEMPVFIKQRRLGLKAGDEMNSFFAALGIDACRRAGIEFEPSMLLRALDAWVKNPHDAAASVAAQRIYRSLLGQDFRNDDEVERRVAEIDRHYDIKAKWGYQLLALAQVGAELGKDRWRSNVKAFLIASQKPDGSWNLQSKDAAADTCLALYILDLCTRK